MTALDAAGTLAGVGVVAITQLGDTWFLFGLLVLLHWRQPAWLADRRTTGLLLATAILAVASVLAAKVTLAVPRPPTGTPAPVPTGLPALLADAIRAGATADGYAFPSGHATLATTVYGGLAATASHRTGSATRYRYWLVAGTLVVVVAASRVAVSVHAPRDVIAGVVLGTAVLALGLSLADPARTLALACLVALVGTFVAVNGPATADVHDTAGSLGAAVGGVVAWRWSGPVTTRVSRGLVVAVGALLTATWAMAITRESLPVVALGNALAVGLAIALPALAERGPGVVE